MSLFIGNVSKKVTSQEFEDAFKGYGNCKIDLRVLTLLSRKDTLLCSMIARDALNRQSKPYKIPILVACAWTLSGPKTQEGSTRTTNPKTTAIAEKEATQGIRAGRNSRGTSEDHRLLNVELQPILKTKPKCKTISPNAQEIMSKNLFNLGCSEDWSWNWAQEKWTYRTIRCKSKLERPSDSNH